ncbi:MAG: PAS domain S-box-containing protein [Cyclobacteriaceae bacterium]|jgi:PAS domain S-box-containing protein
MDAISGTFILLDSQLNFIDINKTTEANIGQSKEQLVGSNIGDIVPNDK